MLSGIVVFPETKPLAVVAFVVLEVEAGLGVEDGICKQRYTANGVPVVVARRVPCRHGWDGRVLLRGKTQWIPLLISALLDVHPGAVCVGAGTCQKA